MPPQSSDRPLQTSDIMENREEKSVEPSVPTDVPSIGELKKSLPPHCFTPSLSLSFYYVLKDLAIMASLYASMIVLTEGPLSMPWWFWIINILFTNVINSLQ